ncbi:MAG: hypothetical protein WC542_10455 [Paludibacter sp.]
MKQLFLSLVFLTLFQLTANAQYEFGTYYIDANLDLDISNEKIDITNGSSSKNNAFNINPEIGYFIKNNLAIGIGFNYKNTLNFDSHISYIMLHTNGSVDYTLSGATSNELNEIAPSFFIKYFYQPTKKLSLSLKASYSKGWGTYNLIQKYIKDPQGEETIFKSEKNKIESKYICLSPELQYLITSKLGLQINFDGLSYISTTKYDNVFNLNGFNPSLSTGSITKHDYESINFNIKPAAWSFGVFVLLN